MTADGIRAILGRELRAVAREVAAYPSDQALWQEVPGIVNSGGTLALHLAGNISHYVGAVLGRTGYTRDRTAEFARRAATREEVRATLEAAIASLEEGLRGVSCEMLEGPYPEAVGGRTLRMADFLVHLAAHAGYHLGQLDYHRRLVAPGTATVGALALSELPDLPR